MFPNYVYNKDERALSWNLNSSIIFFYIPRNNMNVLPLITSPACFLFFSFSSPPSSLSLHALHSNVRMPSNLTIPNQCSRFSSGSIMDFCITIFSLCISKFTLFFFSFLQSFSHILVHCVVCRRCAPQ